MGKLRVMGAAEIADRLRVSRQRAYQITSRRDFPAPVAELGQGKIWLHEDVEQWMAKHRPPAED